MDVAIIALDAVLPGSPDGEHWLKAADPALRPLPSERWPGAPRLSDRAGTPDHALGLVGGWIGPDGGIPWTEQVIRRVLDAGKVKPARTELVLANLLLPSTAAVRALTLPTDRPPALIGEPDPRHATSAAAHAARHFGLRRAVALDAACASGLYAVRLAIDALASGRCDAAIAAGVQACDPSYLLVGFSQLLALSPSGTARPLDARADGLVVGEGVAAVLLKRLPDAVRDGDAIHAVIRAGGLGNDGRKGNLLAPNPSGQLRAMSAAWRAAGLDPTSVGYVECHATGTVVGDGSELEALAALVEGASRPVAVGSCKGLIGHTITAAGLAGLLRAVGAVRDGRFPAGPETPAAGVTGPLTPSVGGKRWTGERRAAVSAFGFGGTNAHLVLDAPPRKAARKPAAPPARGVRASLRRLIRGEPPPAPEPPVVLPPPARLTRTPRLAVVGVGGQVGSRRGSELFEAMSAGRPIRDGAGRAPVDAVAVDPRRWRIPPLELAELIPQQLLALEIGADALDAAPPVDPARTGVVFGMALDPAVCEQVARWALEAPDRAPPLDDRRVLGQLPNFAANRLSAQLDLQGPSYVVAADRASGFAALDHAGRLIASGACDAVVVGAVDLEGPAQGAVAVVVRAAEGTPDDAVLAVLDLEGSGGDPAADPGPLGGLLALVERLGAGRGGGLSAEGLGASLGVDVLFRRRPAAAEPKGTRTLIVENRRWTPPGPFGPGPVVVRSAGEVQPATSIPGAWFAPVEVDAEPERAAGGPPRAVALDGSWQNPSGTPRTDRHAGALEAPAVSSPAHEALGPPAAESDADAWSAQLDGLAALAAGLAASHAAMSDAHAAWLAGQVTAARALTAFVDDPSKRHVPHDVSTDLHKVDPTTGPPRTAERTQPAPAALPSPEHHHEWDVSSTSTPHSSAPPRTYDREALLRHATGELSEVFGPSFADQDAYEPRTRMPAPPLLLCSRVLDVEGTPGQLGPARILTEYDLPTDASWSRHDGRPNACVLVESGQADLFLVSFLGIERQNRGERVYRLLDCDLTFHGERPECGETLRHDIRIDRFARLGGKTLFYFRYDAVSTTTGRPVLTMRNGVAGFFTPAELATPQGVDPKPAALASPPRPLAPLRPTSVTALDERGVQALVNGRFSEAFGPAFRDADGSRLTLPDSEWRLVHRVAEVRTQGGPYGLGLARVEQVLRDDDWFNPGHFVGDPCMPGTLMLEGCLQAVQTWLLAAGVPATHRDHRFEPMPDLPFQLRCRGQVVPGHALLVYEARIKEASLDGTPHAIADVLLSVDGTPVVIARDIGVTVGERPPREGDAHGNVIIPADLPASSNPGSAIDRRRILEYSIGDAERAFGPRYAAYAGISPRCARMPGPPLLQMTRVLFADRPGEVRQGARVAIAYDVPPDAWFFRTMPGTSMPFAVLLETALQPCGWLTAWQAAGIKDGRDLSFRNLGGTATQHVEVWPDAGTLVTETTQTVVAESAGLLIHHFALTVKSGSTRVYECTTSFGYFTAQALDGQRGLGLKDEARREACRAKCHLPPIELAGHPSMPRDDWRNLDAVTHLDPAGGKAGLGFYQAVKRVDPAEWFFVAHFFLDPVMPGSLGLEAALQLARFVFEQRTGQKARTTPIRLGVPHTWKYRGQVRRPVREMTLELEVTALSDTEIVFDAVLRADGLPIYELVDFGLTAAAPRALPPLPRPARGPHAAALLDTFEVRGDEGTGRVRLDPARFPWLADHCPTVTAPALPLAFAAEIAAEAASLLRPGRVVVGLPTLEAERWIHAGEGPVDLLVVAVASGDSVAVSLAVHVENRRFPKLSGPKVHMRAVVALAERYPDAPRVALGVPGAARVPMTAAQYYAGGLTFHGPTLQGMTDLGVRSPAAALATFRTRPDAELNGPGAPFVLDPLLLDTATHPMVSGEPETWSSGIGPGHLAYPVKAEGMRLFGPRPSGEVRCRLDLVAADARALVFDVALVPAGADRAWCTFRWTEALVPGGPVLGQPTPVRRAFVWEGLPRPEVRLGRSVGERFRVEAEDLVEPLEGTLVRLLCASAEVDAWRSAADRRAWQLARFAAKGACRARLQAHGLDAHPRELELFDVRDDLYAVVNAPGLGNQAWIELFGPTRFHLRVQVGTDAAEAWFEPTGWPT